MNQFKGTKPQSIWMNAIKKAYERKEQKKMEMKLNWNKYENKTE